MSTEHKRRNSLERYQPRGNPEQSADSCQLSENFNGLSVSDSTGRGSGGGGGGGRGSRRGVNSHLYANTGHNNRGKGRGSSNCTGRGRGQREDRGPRQYHDNNGQKVYYNDSLDHNAVKNKQQSHYHNPRNTDERNSSWGQANDGRENMKFQAPDPVSKHQHNKSSMHQFERNYKPHKKNTETFKPSHKPAEMRILCAPVGWTKYSREIMSRDVLIINGLFCEPTDLTLYKKLLNEIKTSGIDQEDLWKLWHGDSHVIADDKLKWKEACPTFHAILHKIQEYFEMDIKGIYYNI